MAALNSKASFSQGLPRPIIIMKTVKPYQNILYSHCTLAINHITQLINYHTLLIINTRWLTTCTHTLLFELENVAINDVLPLKAARRDAIANLKCFWGLGHQRPNFNGYIYIHCAATRYSARISAIYFLPFGNVGLGSVVCNAWEIQCRIYEGWVRILILL